jgi:integrative and conjugative element protein (TIGR02256 family)
MTKGQQFALSQLEEIAASGNQSLEIESRRDPTDDKPWLVVWISIRVGPIPTSHGGLDLREREAFIIHIPPTFPFKKPEVDVPHDRFTGFPHVQWKYRLCLYRSSAEWNPSDGMFGYLDRLDYWIKQGALNQLEPDLQPLHPPVVYTDRKNGKLVVPRKDTPPFEGPYWIGVASIQNLERRIEIIDWHDIDQIPSDGTLAMALLFGTPMPWEYPSKGKELFAQCDDRGIPKEQLYGILKASALLTPPGESLYFILGSPMRGFTETRKQHLSIWAIGGEAADHIRLTVSEHTDTTDIEKIRTRLAEIMVQELETTDISWCPVMEARPEVTIRRDRDASISHFHGKSVSVWGCGALGGHIAVHLCRAGVTKLVLRDKGRVTPGILVRQPYTPDDIDDHKVNALKKHLLQIRPDLQIETHDSDIETELSRPDFDWRAGTDVVIDATASHVVRRRLEMKSTMSGEQRAPVACLMIDRDAQRMVSVIVDKEYMGGTWDVLRKAKLETLRDPFLKQFSDAFFPKDNTSMTFQPEPGCSEPTFIGSSADCNGMASVGLNMTAKALSQITPRSATALFWGQPNENKSAGAPSLVKFSFPADFCLTAGSQEIRVTPGALKELKGWIAQNKRLRRGNVETGGLAWGEWDDATSIIWVSGFSGPPPDSTHSEESFVRGVAGTKKEHESRIQITRGSVGYIGEWHTHPVSKPFPSVTDLEGIQQTLTVGGLPPRKIVLMIIGKQFGVDTIGAYVFRRSQRGEVFHVITSAGITKPLPGSIL